MARTVVVYAADLLSSTQVTDTARQLGYSARTASDPDQLIAELDSSPDLLLVDAAARPDWPAIVAAAKPHGTPVVAFGNHTDLAARERALTAGVNGVVANSLVATDLAGILRKYARRN